MGISLGLVGLGMFGGAFADMFMSHPNVDRIALCDREVDRMDVFANKDIWQNKFNRKDMYESLDDILQTDLDAIVLITQPWLHAEQAVKTMEAGKHVYSAVPIVSIPDGDEILDWCDKVVETSRRTGLRYMLGETSYYRANAMFCRRKAADGLFGNFVYAEGEYFHDVDHPYCNLRGVAESRMASKAGQEWLEYKKKYDQRGILTGPMHYPTHSTCGPVSVMNAHAKKVTCYGYKNQTNDPFSSDVSFSNETALFEMSNGATIRILEFRECGGHIGNEEETFRIVGTKGTYTDNKWMCNFRDAAPEDVAARKALAQRYENQSLTDEDMRDPLPEEVAKAFGEACAHQRDAEGDFTPTVHGGSHPYLVNEFVDAIVNNRQPAINAWEACRYMAMGVMAHKSALKDGERLDVPDWGDAPE